METDKIKLLAHISEVRKNLNEMIKILNDKRSVDEGEKSFMCKGYLHKMKCVTQCEACRIDEEKAK